MSKSAAFSHEIELPDCSLGSYNKVLVHHDHEVPDKNDMSKAETRRYKMSNKKKRNKGRGS
jgi:hypothetical protein